MNQVEKRPLDSIAEGFDSRIHASNSYFYKAYFSHITKEILDDYCKMHTFLSQFEREFNLSMPQSYKGEQIKKIIFDVISLDNKLVYEAAHVKDKKAHMVSYPQYIEGENLEYYQGYGSEYDDDDKNICFAIRDNIIQRLSMYFPYIHMESLSLSNIMVTHTKDNTLYCTITDLGDNIASFINDQKEFGKWGKIQSGEIRKRKSDKNIVRWKKNGELIG